MSFVITTTEYPAGVGASPRTMEYPYPSCLELGFAQADNLAIEFGERKVREYIELHPDEGCSLDSIYRPYNPLIDKVKPENDQMVCIFPKPGDR